MLGVTLEKEQKDGNCDVCDNGHLQIFTLYPTMLLSKTNNRSVKMILCWEGANDCCDNNSCESPCAIGHAHEVFPVHVFVSCDQRGKLEEEQMVVVVT